jgi:peroxiredoxin
MKRILQTLLLLCFSAVSINTVFAQGYRIEVKIEGMKDTSAYLAHYFDGRIFADDTTRLDHTGKGIFSKKERLPQGIYVLYLPNQKYFDLLIGEDQDFNIRTNPEDFIGSMKIDGAKETEGFHGFQQFMKSQNENSKKLQEEYKAQKDSPGAKKKYQEAFKKADQQVRDYIDQLEKDFPSPSFLSRFALFTLSPDIPDFSKTVPQETKDRDKEIQRKAYYYNRAHYFDHTDFADDRFLRTPLLKNKLEHYFSKMLIQNPDTVYHEATKIIEKARPNKDCFQYIVQYALNNAIQSKIMGMDAAFVKIAKRYYLSGEATWADSTLMANIRERVFNLQFNLIGEKSHDLKLQTIDGEYVSLHETDAAYTVLYFWEPSCGHCKKTTPRLKTEIYDAFHDKGVKVFAVYTQDKKEEWEEFVSEHNLFDFINCYDPNFHSNFRIYYDIHSTPAVYLLDKNKNIIAKRIDIDTLKEFLNHELISKKN